MLIAANMTGSLKAVLRIVSLYVFLIPGDPCDAKEGAVILHPTEKTVQTVVLKVNTACSSDP